ncbi:MAG TPA: TonB-dependent receptor plug domain-containing protein, partial [Gemmatimonadales bacterium]
MKISPLFLLLLPVALTAQVPAGDSAYEVSPLVTTAERSPLPAGVVSGTITVLQGDELRAQGVRTVAEALRQVPGAAVVSSGSFGGQTSLFLRGGESDYVKVLIDGVAMNQSG